MSIRPYQADARCPKCGSTKLQTEYERPHPGGPVMIDVACAAVEVGVEPLPERLFRQCGCGFTWLEHVADVDGQDA